MRGKSPVIRLGRASPTSARQRVALAVAQAPSLPPIPGFTYPAKPSRGKQGRALLLVCPAGEKCLWRSPQEVTVDWRTQAPTDLSAREQAIAPSSPNKLSPQPRDSEQGAHRQPSDEVSRCPPRSLYYQYSFYTPHYTTNTA